MLVADFDWTVARSGLTKSQYPGSSETPSSPIHTNLPSTFKADVLTFGQFKQSYWPRFDQGLTKRLGTTNPGPFSFFPHINFQIDPALVWSEFMGILKGSEESLQTQSGYLTRAEYLGLSHRIRSTFVSKRDAIYSLFEAYHKLKLEMRGYDAADR